MASHSSSSPEVPEDNRPEHEKALTVLQKYFDRWCTDFSNDAEILLDDVGIEVSDKCPDDYIAQVGNFVFDIEYKVVMKNLLENDQPS